MPFGFGKEADEPDAAPEANVRIHRVVDPGSESVLNFPAPVGSSVVRFDAEGNAYITEDQWKWLAPYAVKHGVSRVDG